jgi:hypothetical protein
MAFTLYDVYGKAVRAGRIDNTAFILDVTDLDNGVYFLQPGEVSERGIRVIKK